MCALCNHVTRYMIDGFPCRVCGDVFHEECLHDSDQYDDAQVRMVQRAKAQLGWSCEKCVRILLE